VQGLRIAPSRILASAALALAILIWLGPPNGEAITPADPKKERALPCLNKSGTAYKARIAPKLCAHFGPDGSFARGVDLHDIRWDDWGEGTVTGIATECGFKSDCASVDVHVTASRVRRRCGRPVYTRLSARSNLGTTVVKTKACLGPA
jgi:hypothetical protein